MQATLAQLDAVPQGGAPGLTAITVPTVDAGTVGAFVPLAIGLLVTVAVVIIGVFVARRWLQLWHMKRQAGAFAVMLVTVPKESAEKGDSGSREKTLQEVQEDIGVMESVFASVGGLKAERGLKAWFLGREDHVAFEIVAKEGLVSFYVAAPAHLREFIEQQIHGQYPLAQIEEIPDYNIFSAQGAVVSARLKLKRSHIFPIKSYKKLESDPLNSLTNALAKVEKTDGAAIQFVVRSARKEWRAPAVAFVRAVQSGKSVKEALGGGSIVGEIGKAVSTKKPSDKNEPAKLTPLEEEMVKAIDEKASKLGLDVTIRVIASAPTAERAQLYLTNITGAFSQYTIPQYGNMFDRSKEAQAKTIHDFIYRRFSDKPRSVLTGEELAGLYHMPLPSTETPNIRWLLARRPPPPTNLPKEGLEVGFVEYRGDKIPVFIKKEDRFRHLYMIGKSGSGKSEFIATMAVQDIRNGDGVCVVDPHGDLVETILGNIPRDRVEDVIVFDPSDTDRPLGLNMLEAMNKDQRDFVAGEMIAIFYKLFPPEVIGPMFEHNMRNFMLTLMSDEENPGTIAEIPRLISDAAYQKKWVAKVEDPVIRNFWENEIAKTSDFHKSEMLGYLISKVGRFVENALMRNIIGQQKSAFDFRKVMDDKKILLVNLSKGKIGDINANLLGLIIVTKLQMAAFSRAEITDKSLRKDFFLYIDEFQNFITPSIATILSEARKYRLSLTIAHQYLGQLSPKGDNEIRDAVLGNVGTIMVGRIGIEDAQILEKEFAPVFNALDLINVEQFTWNTKMLIDNTASRPFTMKPTAPVKGDPRLANAIKQLARLKYGRDRELVELEILERTQLGAAARPTVQGPEASKSV
jgi:hypothetical protein